MTQLQLAWPETELKDRVVYVVDANSLIFQVYHALPEMISPQGENVNAVRGFTSDVLALWEQKSPDYLLFAFDRAEPTFRHQLVNDYKGQRSELPVDLAPQFGKIERVLAALGLPALSCAGFEADDILATVAQLCEERGARCFLVTGDKDCRQLLSDRVNIYNIRKREVYDAAALAKDWGILPGQVVDFQTLVGDSVDNIAGVPLVGPKAAGEWLKQFGSLEALLANTASLPKGKKKENLLAAAPRLPLTRRLVELDRKVPIEIPWDAARPGKVNRAELQALFTEFGFHALRPQLDALCGTQSAIPLPVSSQTPATFRTVTTADELRELEKAIRAAGQVSLDTETTHINPRWAELVGISCCWENDSAVYIPLRAPYGSTVARWEDVQTILGPILADPQVGKLGQNLKYDLIVLRAAGLTVQGVAFDTLIASFVVDAGERAHNLDELAKRYLQHQTIKIESLIGTGKNQKRMDEVPLPLITDYAAEDAWVVWKLTPLLKSALQTGALESLYYETELPLVSVLADLEFTGISVDVPRLAGLRDSFLARLEALEQEIHQLAGCAFNMASPKQLGEVLFQKLGLPIVKRTKTGPSTDSEVLEELATVHPLPAKMMEHRQLSKLLGTYVEALPTLVCPVTKRVHTSFHQAVASTGRLSSSDPNLQNIPVRTETGRQIRSAFQAGPAGWKLLAADYSQIELRVLAHFCGDPTLIRAFAEDQDIHRLVAAQVNGVPLDSVTAEMRQAAKAVNFGVIYGQTPFGLAKQLGISKQEAATFIEAYFARYPGVSEFIERTLEDCLKQGYVSTFLGRRRSITGVRTAEERNQPGRKGERGGVPSLFSAPLPASARQLNLPERTAVNAVIQGSAADMIKKAMLVIQAKLADRQTWRAQMLLQIHDELLFEAPDDELPALGAMVQREMSGVLELKVPVRVDLKSGPNWAECEAW